MPADVLSDVLRAVRLTGAVYFDFDLTSPWVTAAPPARELTGKVLAGSERLIEYHLVEEGTCWGNAIGQEPIRLRAGDLILFPQGDPHVLASAPGLQAVPDMSAFARPSASLPIFYELGGRGADRARIVCCFLGLDERPFNPLLGALPQTIHLSALETTSAPTGWLRTLLNAAAAESGSRRSGSENVLARLSELIFVETIRRYIETLPAAEKSWLAGLRDPEVGRALATLHGEPAAPWTVEGLAHAVGLSRSILAERFTEMVGHPPMHYLALWRMQLASRRLIDGEPVAAAASAVGYESEAAFSRAFKKHVGASPAAWRNTRRPAR